MTPEDAPRELRGLVLGLEIEVLETQDNRAPEGGPDGLSLALLYGESFRRVADLARAEMGVVPVPGSRAAAVWHEAVVGLSAFRTWQKTLGPVNAPPELSRMAAQWARLVGATLAGK